MKLDSYEKWKNSAASLSDDCLDGGNLDEAQRLVGKVLLVNPGETDFRFRLQKALRARGKKEELRAESLFLFHLMLRDERVTDAYRILEDLSRDFPDDVNVKWKLAGIAVQTGHEEKAEALYLALAEFYMAKALPEKAAGAYRQIIRLGPEKFEYSQKIADIFVQQGMVKEAIDEYFVLLGNYQERKMSDKAVALLEKMLILDPLNKSASTTLAKLNLDQGKLNEGSRVIRNQVERRVNKGLIDEAMNFSQEWIEVLISRRLSDQVRAEREYLAKALFSHDRREQGIVLFGQVAEDELAAGNLEKFVDLMQQVAHFYLTQGDINKARSGYQKLIIALADRDEARARTFIDEFLRELLQRERIRELDQALREMSVQFEAQGKLPLSEELLRRLAEIYVSIYKLQEAIKVYKLIVEKNGQDPKVYIALGELYIKEEKWQVALDCFMEAVKLYAKNNQPDKAEEIFNYALQKDPRNPSLLSRMGDNYYTAGEWDKALGYYQRALEIEPTFRQAVVGTAMAYAKKGMLDDMVALAKRLVTKGVIAEIIEEYRKALSLNPNQFESAMALGLLYKDLGFVEEAILEFQKASRDQKLFLKAYSQLGLCFKDQGFQDLAIRQYRKALERPGYSDEEFLEIRYNLARTYEEVKMYREAQELYSDIQVVDIGYKDVSERVKNLASGGGTGKVVSLPSDWGSGGKKS